MWWMLLAGLLALWLLSLPMAVAVGRAFAAGSSPDHVAPAPGWQAEPASS